MKKVFAILFFTAFCFHMLRSQSVTIDGKPLAEIFTDFHYSFNDTVQRNGFYLNRANLGYEFLPEGNFSSRIIVNVGSPDDLAEGSVLKRYAYFREASVTYSKDRLTLSFGIANTRNF